MRRRWLVLTSGSLLAGVIGIAVPVWAVVGATPAPLPDHADAIVALAGEESRAALAVALFDDGLADRLILSHPSDGGAAASDLVARTCETPPPGVQCVDPDPATTRGEAEAVARLVAGDGLRSVVVVTSDYHARRAGYLFGRCLDASVTVAHVDSDGSWGTVTVRAINELGGILDAWLRPPCS
ncbi:MAG: YdcF family protein [Euzebya sp.]